jgi:hypothetical protein
MKIKTLKNIHVKQLRTVGYDIPVLEGTIIDVPEKMGNEIVKDGLAKKVTSGTALKRGPKQSAHLHTPSPRELAKARGLVK